MNSTVYLQNISGVFEKNVSSITEPSFCSFILRINDTYVLPIMCLIGVVPNVLLVIAQYRILVQQRSDKMFVFLTYRTYFELSLHVLRILNPVIDTSSYIMPNDQLVHWIAIFLDRFLRSAMFVCSDFCNVSATLAFLIKFNPKWNILCIRNQLLLAIFVLFSFLLYSHR